MHPHGDVFLPELDYMAGVYFVHICGPPFLRRLRRQSPEFPVQVQDKIVQLRTASFEHVQVVDVLCSKRDVCQPEEVDSRLDDTIDNEGLWFHLVLVSLSAGGEVKYSPSDSVKGAYRLPYLSLL